MGGGGKSRYGEGGRIQGGGKVRTGIRRVGRYRGRRQLVCGGWEEMESGRHMCSEQ